MEDFSINNSNRDHDLDLNLEINKKVNLAKEIIKKMGTFMKNQ
jgi:hypothetical protein